MNQPTNPLDDLQQFDQSSLPRRHSSGRRELRHQFFSRGITMHHQSPDETAAEEKLAIAKTGQPAHVTRPLKFENERKRLGMTKKEWKRYRREQASKGID